MIISHINFSRMPVIALSVPVVAGGCHTPDVMYYIMTSKSVRHLKCKMTHFKN